MVIADAAAVQSHPQGVLTALTTWHDHSMKRRDLLIGVTLAAVAAHNARAQPPTRKYRLAIFHPATPIASMVETGPSHYAALFGELRRLGYIEGGNLVVERFSGEGRPETYGEIAREIVRIAPDVIFPVSNRLVRHLQSHTRKIPIVAMTSDPVGYGFAASLSRPGGNITGVTVDAGLEIMEKFLEILREINSSASKIGYLAPTDAWGDHFARVLLAATSRAGVSMLGPPLQSPIQREEYRRVTYEMVRGGAEIILVADAPENFAHRDLIVRLAEEHQIPFLYPLAEYVRIGGLMSYSSDNEERYRRIAGYIDRIFRGEDPSNLPFYQPTNFLLTINLRVAKALRLTIPPTLLGRADEVIE